MIGVARLTDFIYAYAYNEKCVVCTCQNGTWDGGDAYNGYMLVTL